MVRILAAATLPINPPNAGIVLTLPQIWAGLISKCRAPQDFVKAMESCAIVDESETGMRRVVTYKKGQHPRGRAGEEEDDVQEKIELQAPMM
ncbi:hypothetical protein MMC06_006080, partial [Schaereria dolodes]|nr:hypothetical protein [Schaereria dolodes]